MKPEVLAAIEEIRTAFECDLNIEDDPEGGAYVKALDLDIGSQYSPSRSWVAFRITFQYPFADVYPHMVVPQLRRADGNGLGEAFHIENQFWAPPSGPQPAVMVSRRSPHRNPAVETAAIKLAKVLEWIRSR
jgi:hypothetical protein